MLSRACIAGGDFNVSTRPAFWIPLARWRQFSAHLWDHHIDEQQIVSQLCTASLTGATTLLTTPRVYDLI